MCLHKRHAAQTCILHHSLLGYTPSV
jgi:hypothetical protein